MPNLFPSLVCPLRAAGYTVLPFPREVLLTGGTAIVSADWRLDLRDVADDDIAVRTLRDGLASACGFRLSLASATGAGTIALGMEAESGFPEAAPACRAQAYRLAVNADSVVLTAAGSAGLLYGVHTLLQLLESGRGRLPLGVVRDWPRLAWRCIHWDTKHHQDRLATLRRYLDQAARYKINAVLFELEDKFAYPSHPVIGAPGAFTTRELQDLADYALERHIQIIPDVQSPAHMCYVLKHEQFAGLRCDGSNYQACMDDPAARQLLFAMYDDVCDATRGSKFFHVSTDEVYYAGICEKYRRPYNPENRSLTLVEYIRAAHERLTARQREMLIWLEYPLLPEHIRLLPADVINGVASRDPVQKREEEQRGIRRFVYWPAQGSELLFPRYFPFETADGKPDAGRLAGARETFFDPVLTEGPVLGAIAAAWDDAGLHNETFWLGWTHMAQHAWAAAPAPTEEITAAFMVAQYGQDCAEAMAGSYRALHEAARQYERTLDRLPSAVRGPAYGHPLWKGPMPRCDFGMIPPAPPRLPNDTAVSVSPVFARRYADALAQAPARVRACERELERLYARFACVARNRYSLEVFVSLFAFLRQFFRLATDVAHAETLLADAARSGRQGQNRPARQALEKARDTVRAALAESAAAFAGLREIWENSQRERNAPADGKTFVHVLDDVKDHFADRRADLSYLTAPQESLALDTWLAELDLVIERFDAIPE